MNFSNYRVSLDMHDTSSQVMLNVKQGDSARKICFSLTDGGRPYKISADCTARLRAKTSSGTILFNDCTIKDNVIEYTLTSATCKNVGIVECEVTLYGADSNKITSPHFSLIVEGVITSDNEVESTNEFTALDKALNESNNLDISVSKVKDTATISITHKDGTTETAIIKDGANGKDGNDGKDGYTPQKGVDYFDGADGKDADVTELASAIVGTAKGTTLSITDSANVNLRNLKVYGKSMQDGTPTPDAPIEISSVGDDGEISLNITSRNMVKSKTVFPTTDQYASVLYVDADLKPNTQYTFSFEGAVGNRYYFNERLFVEGAFAYEVKEGTNAFTITTLDNFTEVYVEGRGWAIFKNRYAQSKPNVFNKLMLNEGSAALPYQEFTEQNITLPTSLRAIPVTDSSLATYTDANGQMWCADEIDLNRGVYIQRVQKASDFFPNQTGDVCDYYSITMPFNSLGTYIHPYALCTHTNEYKYHTEDVTHFYVDGKGIRVYVPKGTNVEGLTVYAMLETPIETPLTAEEIAAYKQLKTNYPNTTITNDENAYMSAEYVIDTKTYIDNLVANALGVASKELASIIALQESYIGGGA